MIFTSEYFSPVGRLFMASDGKSLTGLWIEGQKYFAKSISNIYREDGDIPVFKLARSWLDRYFAGDMPAPTELSLNPNGSDFAKNVWKLLCDIPYGRVTTYGEIARRIAAERGLAHMSAQAIGGAVGHNPISIIIPCHRVIGSDGSLTGYAGGIDKKAALLKHEHTDMTPAFIFNRIF